MNPVQKALRQISAFSLTLFIALAYFLPVVNSSTTSYSGDPRILSGVNPAPTANIKASVASTDGDTLRAYKVVVTTYNSDTNNITHGFSALFRDYLASTAGTGADYSGLEVGSYLTATTENLNNYLAGFAVYAKGHGGAIETNYYSTTSESNGDAVFSNVPMGQYLILGWGSDAGPRVYSLATAEVIPSEGTGDHEGEYVLYGTYHVNLKTSLPTVNKTITGGTTTQGSKQSASIYKPIKYQIDASVPTYPPNATATKYEIVDFIPEGLHLDLETVKAYFPTGDGSYTQLINDDETITYYTQDYGEGVTPTSRKLTITFDYSKIKDYSSIRITYEAVLDDEASIGNNSANINKATLSYSSDPFNSELTYTISSEKDVYSYGLIINKYIGGNMEQRLAGAQFKIYTNIACTDLYVIKDDVGQPVVITTNADGFAFYAGLGAGTYYLKESKAPTGYNLIDSPFQFSVGTEPNLITSIANDTLNTYTTDSTGNSRAARLNGETTEYGWIDSTGHLVWNDSASTPPPHGESVPAPVPAYVKSSFGAGENTISSFGNYNGSDGFYWVDAPNSAGPTLPSTGGIGTTIFTVVGIILIVGALVLFITKVRMSKKYKI